MLKTPIETPCWLFAIEILAAFLLGLIVGAIAKRQRSTARQEDEGGVGDGETIELYVGNLSYDVTEKDMRKAFEPYGKVVDTRIIQNKFNGKSKGYGFVEMVERDESDAAIKAMNGKDLMGRKVVVKEARSQPRDK